MSSPPPTIDCLLREAGASIGRLDAEWLLSHLLSRPRSWLFSHASDVVEPARVAAFQAMCTRRAAGEPVAYLTGMQGFWTLELEVSPATLIPRPETERLVELALERIPVDAPVRVADLGTGSGAIALALARERPLATVIATDASEPALQVAQRNAVRNGICNVHFRRGDWLAPLQAELFDLIVANPPYIAQGDPHLVEGDLRFEPASALASGRDGLDAIRCIVGGVACHLGAGGWLLLEHGWQQADAVRALLAGAGFIDLQTARDLEQRDRVSLGHRP